MNRAALALLVAGELALAAAADAKVERSNLLNGVTVAPCILDIIVKSAGCRGGEVKMRDIIERLFKAKWAIVLTVAITLLAMPGGALAQDSWGWRPGMITSDCAARHSMPTPAAARTGWSAAATCEGSFPG